MKARLLIEGASLGPDDLKIAFQAFDGAWKEIASRYTTPEAIEAAHAARHTDHILGTGYQGSR